MIVTSELSDKPCYDCNRTKVGAALISIQIVDKKFEVNLCYSCKIDLITKLEDT
jgi:hypothetical protein